MKSPRLILAGLLATLFALAPTARADMPKGKLVQDLTVGANHDVALKTGQVVQIMNQHGDKTVILVPLPDGSNGIFQINTIAIQSVPAGTPLGLPPAASATPSRARHRPAQIPRCLHRPPPPSRPPSAATPAATPPSSSSPPATRPTWPAPASYSAFRADSRTRSPPKTSPTSSSKSSSRPTPAAQRPPSTSPASSSKPRAPSPPAANPSTTSPSTACTTPARKPPPSPSPASPPAEGDIVWLIARLRNSPPDQLAHRAQVIATKDWLEIQFDDPNLIIGGIIGAPVLNTTGQVVGIFSYGLSGGGNLRGYLIPAPLLAKTIQPTP